MKEEKNTPWWESELYAVFLAVSLFISFVLQIAPIDWNKYPVWRLISLVVLGIAAILLIVWVITWRKARKVESAVDETITDLYTNGETPDFNNSFDKVLMEIAKIKTILKGFTPDLIFGISGEDRVGGTIIGALLASPSFLNMPEKFRQALRNKKLSKELRKEIKMRKFKKFLLLDDESQSGNTIRNEVDELYAIEPEAIIIVAVIVVRSKSWTHHYDDLWKNENKNICIYKNVPDGTLTVKNGVTGAVSKTVWHDVKWPWDAGKPIDSTVKVTHV